MANPPVTGTAPHPNQVPSYPPVLSPIPLAVELTTSWIWWEEDNVVSHILILRLMVPVLSILPFNDNNESLNHKLHVLFTSCYNNFTVFMITHLARLQCGGCVLDYVTKWWAGITQLWAAKFVMSFHIVIECFLDHLPMSVPYDILQFWTMETINSIPVDDLTAFIKLTDKVVKIDNTYCHMSHPCPPPTRSSNTTLRVLSTS